MREVRNYELDHKLKAKSDDLLYQIQEYGIDLQSNHIYLTGSEGYTYGTGSLDTNEPGVEYTMATKFIKNINLCMRVNALKPLLILKKTCGGDWVEGMAIYDAIRSYPAYVTILNYTHSRSMSSLIMQAGNKRVMMPNSYFMLHDGTTGAEGTIKQVRAAIKFEKRVADKTMLDIYAKPMQNGPKFKNKSLEYIKRWIRSRMDKEEDVFLTAREAVEYGLADEIFDYNWANLTKYTTEQKQR